MLNSRFGRGTGPVLLDRFGCTGREQNLLNCSQLTSSYCIRYDVAGVRCSGESRISENVEQVTITVFLYFSSLSPGQLY